MAKVNSTPANINGNARNILQNLEHLINNGQWQQYNKKLDNLAKKHADKPEVIKMIEGLKIKNKKDFQAKHKKAGESE